MAYGRLVSDDGKRRFGSVQPGVGTGVHDASAPRVKLTSSASPGSRFESAGTFALGSSGVTVPEAISCRTSLAVMTQGWPSVRVQLGSGVRRPASFAFIAALKMIPAMPAPSPVAFDEQLELGIARV